MSLVSADEMVEVSMIFPDGRTSLGDGYFGLAVSLWQIGAWRGNTHDIFAVGL